MLMNGLPSIKFWIVIIGEAAVVPTMPATMGVTMTAALTIAVSLRRTVEVATKHMKLATGAVLMIRFWEL